MNKTFAVLLLSLATTALWAADGPSRLIRVHTKDREAITKIALTGADIVAKGKGWIDVVENVKDRSLTKLLGGPAHDGSAGKCSCTF